MRPTLAYLPNRIMGPPTLFRQQPVREFNLAEEETKEIHPVRLRFRLRGLHPVTSKAY